MPVDPLQQMMIYIRQGNAPALRKFLDSAHRANLLHLATGIEYCFNEALRAGSRDCAAAMLDCDEVVLAMGRISTVSACNLLHNVMLSGDPQLLRAVMNNKTFMALVGEYACYTTGVNYSEDHSYNLSFFMAPRLIQMAEKGYHESLALVLSDTNLATALLRNLDNHMIDCFTEGAKAAYRGAVAAQRSVTAAPDGNFVECISLIMNNSTARERFNQSMHHDDELFRAIAFWQDSTPPGSSHINPRAGTGRKAG